VLAAVFVAVTAWALFGAGVRATYGGRVTADEPQYLLSAISLAEDLDLDIADELAAERWRDFHRAELPRQTEPRPDGAELSPHDPLLPALLAPGVAVAGAVAGGWEHAELAGARAVLALAAGALAALLVWTAVARLGVRTRTAVLAVGAFALSAPLSAYGSQLYPELVAALAVAGGAAALLGCRDPFRPHEPRSATGGGGARTGRGRTAAWVLAVVALPWLGVKYAGVAAALALLGLVLDRRHRWPALGVLGLAGIAYLVVHQRVYGGWTVYAAGDHFVGGELTVVGNDPDHLGRSVRLLGLLVDRHFGLVVWAPGFLLAVPAVAAVLRRRDAAAAVLLAPLAAGWATATWVALTMHGFWWSGRQTVVVLPIAVLLVARWAPAPLTVAGLVAGAVTWWWLVADGIAGRVTWVVHLGDAGSPVHRLLRPLLPDLRDPGDGDWALLVAWTVVAVGLLVLGWRSAGGDEDAGAREGADADRAVLDLHRDRAVG